MARLLDPDEGDDREGHRRKLYIDALLQHRRPPLIEDRKLLQRIESKTAQHRSPFSANISRKHASILSAMSPPGETAPKRGHKRSLTPSREASIQAARDRIAARGKPVELTPDQIGQRGAQEEVARVRKFEVGITRAIKQFGAKSPIVSIMREREKGRIEARREQQRNARNVKTKRRTAEIAQANRVSNILLQGELTGGRANATRLVAQKKEEQAKKIRTARITHNRAKRELRETRRQIIPLKKELDSAHAQYQTDYGTTLPSDRPNPPKEHVEAFQAIVLLERQHLAMRRGLEELVEADERTFDDLETALAGTPSLTQTPKGVQAPVAPEGKSLTLEEAKRFLKQAKGDKAKAREAARKAGFIF